jgi:hypothetical protein
MYTELSIGVEFRKDTPPDVINTISSMAEGDGRSHGIDHPLFQTERWGWMLRYGGSYYFDTKPHLSWAKDEITNTWHLTFGTNIKNYSNEWEHFLDFIAPHLKTDGYIGTYRYEESAAPTLLYAEGGCIRWAHPVGGCMLPRQIERGKIMTLYNVELPLVGSLLFQVEADSPEEAITMAEEIPWRLAITEGREAVELGETFETPRYINRGNICSAPCPEATAEED